MSPTVLVVDDNLELVALLTSLFEEAGYAIVGHTRGRPAIDAAKTTYLDLAIIDLLLPDMMGYHVAESIRAARPGIPLVFMSGVFKGARHSGDANAKFPGSRYFEKPFDARQLLDDVRRLVPVPTPPPRPANQGADEPFDVELDIDVEDNDEQEQMELTGKIKVTGGGNITAELKGADLTAGPR